MLRRVVESSKSDSQVLFELAQLRGVITYLSKYTDLRLPDVLVEWAENNPGRKIVGYTTETILILAKKVGVRETKRPET